MLNMWLLVLAVILILGLAKATRLLEGPATRGTRVSWKKDWDPAVASDASPLLTLLLKCKIYLLSLSARKVSWLLVDFSAPLGILISVSCRSPLSSFRLLSPT